MSIARTTLLKSILYKQGEPFSLGDAQRALAMSDEHTRHVLNELVRDQYLRKISLPVKTGPVPTREYFVRYDRCREVLNRRWRTGRVPYAESAKHQPRYF